MNKLLLLLLLPIFSLAQNAIHKFEIISDTLIYDTGDYKVGLQIDPLYVAHDNHFMTNDILSVDGVEFKHDGRRITVNGRKYKYKSPWLEFKNFLIDVEADEMLLSYDTDSHARKTIYRPNTENLNKLNASDRKVLEIWALYNEMIHAYNSRVAHPDTDDDCLIINTAVMSFE
ncbi:hypothetical protein [Nonlabens ponticola]|uniref:DUF4369 domain-containing protein n=1 Tax=Nonlabens ponticola TaxID=2496866 RepID=A0A3S9MUF0_9FLAO|nr:hypothetical protein [Nonlabens ponticola]AZQ42804.1 hypothetical protein EJ995_00590 [Nonlabens ponticola]